MCVYRLCTYMNCVNINLSVSTSIYVYVHTCVYVCVYISTDTLFVKLGCLGTQVPIYSR